MPKPPGRDADDDLEALLDHASPPRKWEVDKQWARLRAETANSASRRVTGSHRLKLGVFDSHPALRRKLGLLGAGALAVGAFFLVTSPNTSLPRTEAAPEFRDYITDRGVSATIDLPDGSHIMLAPLSHLKVPRSFGPAGRSVELRGEASFDVSHDSARPFRIRAGDAEIVDQGTRFDVRAYDSTAVEVAVADGEVAITSWARALTGRPPVIVSQGSIATVKDGQIVVMTGAVDRYFEWTKAKRGK